MEHARHSATGPRTTESGNPRPVGEGFFARLLRFPPLAWRRRPVLTRLAKSAELVAGRGSS
jgi:hypothetical protein